MSKRFYITVLAAAFVLLVSATPSHASTIQWNLEDITNPDFPTLSITGFFDWTSTSTVPHYTISDWAITFSGYPNPILPTTTLTPLNSSVMTGNTPQFALTEIGQPGLPEINLDLFTQSPLNGSVSTASLFVDGPGFTTESYVTIGYGAVPVTGFLSDISPTPLPAALPLFGCAILGLGAFAWRRKVSA